MEQVWKDKGVTSMKRMAVMLLSAVLLWFSACSTGKSLPVLVQSPLSLCGTQDGVEAFLAENSGYKGSGRPHSCRNITPDFVRDHSSFQVFKYEDTCDSFLLWQDKLLPLGTGFGGLGVTSMALADLNEDGEYELYFTYSFGSGIHRSMLGGFDPSEERVLQPEEVCWNDDTVLTVGEHGELLMSKAEITEYTDSTSLTATPLEPLYRVDWQDGDAALSPLTGSQSELEENLR